MSPRFCWGGAGCASLGDRAGRSVLSVAGLCSSVEPLPQITCRGCWDGSSCNQTSPVLQPPGLPGAQRRPNCLRGEAWVGMELEHQGTETTREPLETPGKELSWLSRNRTHRQLPALAVALQNPM